MGYTCTAAGAARIREEEDAAALQGGRRGGYIVIVEDITPAHPVVDNRQSPVKLWL
jgi:hypothetical protein